MRDSFAPLVVEMRAPGGKDNLQRSNVSWRHSICRPEAKWRSAEGSPSGENCES